jgi:hypothetical protein
VLWRWPAAAGCGCEYQSAVDGKVWREIRGEPARRNVDGGEVVRNAVLFNREIDRDDVVDADSLSQDVERLLALPHLRGLDQTASSPLPHRPYPLEHGTCGYQRLYVNLHQSPMRQAGYQLVYFLA